jgi:hypothetical protein
MSEKESNIEISTGSNTGSTYVPLTDEEVTKLAKAMYKNEVFFSFMIPEDQRANMLFSVFMVLIFMDEITIKQMQANDIDVFYEFYDQAGPRSINGYPCFFSCRSMTRADGIRVIAKYNEIKALLGE